jgi:hypothetical protein
MSIQELSGLLLIAVGLVIFVRVLHRAKLDLDRQDRIRRDPYWFTDQAREEKRARLATFQKQAAKGLSEDSKARAHLQAVTKAGDSRS